MSPSEFMYKAAVAGVTWAYNVRASKLARANVPRCIRIKALVQLGPALKS